MDYNNFFAFINSQDEGDTLTVKYETKSRQIVIEHYKHEELDICPFCGGKAYLQPVNVYTRPGIRVECERCHTRSIMSFVGVNLVTKKSITWFDALTDVIKCWNSRLQAV